VATLSGLLFRLPRLQRWLWSRSGLRQKTTIFAKTRAGPGVWFFNENRTRSRNRSENFSFYRSQTTDLILLNLNFLWTT